MIPYPHQSASADALRTLLVRRKTACDCSETGTGKTVSGLLAAESLGLEFLIICPKNVKTHWGVWVSEMELGGRCLGVLGWEESKLGLHPRLFNPKDGFFLGVSEPRLIVFDEAHRAKSHRTQNARMLGAARRQGHCVLLLSATLLQSPMNLSGLAYPLGLVAQQRQWFDYSRQFGVGISRWGGYDDMSTREHRLRLHHLLAQIGVRVKREDIPGFRDGIIQADLLDAGDARESISDRYAELELEISRLLEEGENAAVILTARLRGRQAIELLKAPIFKEAAEAHLSEGAKVALFLNFNQTVDFLVGEEWGVPAKVITGSSTEKARAEALNAFQGGPARLLILNLGVGAEAISLHNVDGFDRVSLISPGERSTDLIQACGRNVRVGARSPGLNRILFVAGTVEQAVYQNTRRKIRAIANILDGDLDLFPSLDHVNNAPVGS